MALGREEWLPSNSLSVFQLLTKPQFLKRKEGNEESQSLLPEFYSFLNTPSPSSFWWRTLEGRGCQAPLVKEVLRAQKALVIGSRTHSTDLHPDWYPVQRSLASQQGKHFQRKLPPQVQLPKPQPGHHLDRGGNGQVSLEAFTASCGDKVEIGNGSIRHLIPAGMFSLDKLFFLSNS